MQFIVGDRGTNSDTKVWEIWNENSQSPWNINDNLDKNPLYTCNSHPFETGNL